MFSGLDFKDVAKGDVEKMLIPFKYELEKPNERLVYDFIKGFNYWMKVPSDVIEILESLWLTVYDAAVLLDDIIDESEYRRTLPTSHKIFGVPRLLISSQACYMLVLKKMMTLNNPKVVELLSENIMRYLAATYLEVDYKHNKNCPNLDVFEQICIEKADGLMCLPIKMMQTYSDCKTDFNVLSKLMSLHIQYMTDVANLCSPKMWIAKGFCDDFAEGIFTLPSIHAVNTGTLEGNTVYNIICSKTRDVKTQKYCVSLMEKLGSIDFAWKTTIEVEHKVREEIKRLGGNPPLLEYLEKKNRPSAR